MARVTGTRTLRRNAAGQIDDVDIGGDAVEMMLSLLVEIRDELRALNRQMTLVTGQNIAPNGDIEEPHT